MAWKICLAGWPFFLSSLDGLADLIISANSVVVSIGLIARACSIFRAICLENLSSPYLKKIRTRSW